ncbi:MAG: tRNA (N(6)-L-threonylcarbamoyladenosine(37)-C(2))-methylthiotransferase MtaB [Butyricicoccus sp.]|nr:tRNA (N(6)-L-threonylcarbamoyladenosine(37)-C(2))-methylthiotransferase MtaB [Butyricicoccus sp.]
MKYAIATLGCKVNQFESHAIETMLAALGYESTEAGDADVVIINTCAVTSESGRKSRQAVRRLKKENPGALTAVCGCFSQISPGALDEIGADLIYGSADRGGFVADIDRLLRERVRIKSVDDPFHRREFETLPAGAPDGRARAYIKIQDGCDNFCTYCVIPYARGRVRSMPLAEIRRQAGELNEQEFREIVVTGIEIASYGKDLRDGSGLADAVCAAAESAPGARIRLGSLEPTAVTEDFCRRLALCGNICAHFHLSMQSGCDSVLAAMRRKYDTSRFMQSVELLRTYFPGCGLTADMICGFPGETESEHGQSLGFIRRCGFSAMHIFPYSPRPGTKAAALPGHLTRAEKDSRAHSAQLVAEEMQLDYLRAQVGRTLPVLFETGTAGLWHGHADNYCEVCAAGSEMRGIVRNVSITGLEGKKLIGNVI